MGLDIINSGKNLLNSVGSSEVPDVGDNLLGTLGNVASGIVRPTGEPQRAYMWEVSMEDFIDGDFITYYARSVNLPTFSHTPLKRKYAGETYYYPGQDTSSKTFRITFWDDQDLRVYRFFMNWRRLAADSVDGRRVSPNLYQRNMKMALKDTSDAFVDEELAARSCFPMEVSGPELSYESAELFTFDVELASNGILLGNAGGFF